MNHVSPAAIEDFLACRLSPEESRLLVRHLLTRCTPCLALISSLQTAALPTCPGKDSLRRPAVGQAAYSLAFERAMDRVREALSLDPQGNVVRPRAGLE